VFLGKATEKISKKEKEGEKINSLKLNPDEIANNICRSPYYESYQPFFR